MLKKPQQQQPTKPSTRVATLANDENQQQQRSEQAQQAQKYTLNQIVGNGTFGMVYLAINSVTGEKVAIKKVFQDKRYKNREHLIIQELSHPCVIKLKEAFFTQGDKGDDVYLNLVMDYIPDTIIYYIYQIFLFQNIIIGLLLFFKLILNRNLIVHQAKQLDITEKLNSNFPMSYQKFMDIRCSELQLIWKFKKLGIGICHRDIKPQNILVDPATHVLKICDFGSAKKLQKGEPNVAYICSRYYRAPELIYGATEYSTAIDVWSIGCVIAEMLIGEPLFPGESATDQLVEIIKILGTPTQEQVKMMNPQHKDFKFPLIKCHPWQKVFAKFKPDPLFIDLISKLMVYPPKERLRPLEALLHPFFNDLRQAGFGIPNQTLPEFFDFTKEELSIQPEIAPKLYPTWYQKIQ